MKKKIFSIITLFCLIFTSVFPLVACSKDKDNESKEKPQEVKVDFISGLTAEIGDATALGVQYLEDNEISTENTSSKINDGIFAESMLFDDSFNVIASKVNEGSKRKNYIVKYTEDFSNGSVETEKSKISKVKFKKTRRIDEKIYDEQGKLIKENQIVEQDEISAQINKVYVLGNFTFMQFVANEESIKSAADGFYESENYKEYYCNDKRDNGSGITQTLWSVQVRKNKVNTDEFGICDFDKTNYISNKLYQSFVIDNQTGYIYKIKNIEIYEIRNNLLSTNKGICDIRVNGNDELEFFKIVKNETISIYDYYKDIYGHYFVENPLLETYDEESNIMFYKESYYNPDKKYYFTKEGVVLEVNCYADYITGCSINSVYKLNENLEKEEISNSEKYTFGSNNKYNGGDIKFYLVENETIYYSSQYGMFAVKYKEGVINDGYITRPYRHIDLGYNHDVVNNNIIMIIKDGVLTIGKFYGEDSLFYGKYYSKIDVSDYVYYWYGATTTFEKVTASETIYYKLINNGENEWMLVNSKTYVAPESTVVKLQPINKNK